jgi:hypothetical protein
VEVRERFVLWSRAYWASGIFENTAWVACARRHFKRDLDRIQGGDVETLASLLIECPSVAELPGVARVLVKALLRFEPDLFATLAKGLPGKSKSYVTEEMKRASVRSLCVTQAMKRASNALVISGEELFSDAPLPSERKRIARAKGVDKFDGWDVTKNAQAALDRYKVLCRTYPRAVTVIFTCHAGKTRSLHAGGDLPERDAPRLILGPEDEKDGWPPGISLVVVGDR